MQRRVAGIIVGDKVGGVYTENTVFLIRSVLAAGASFLGALLPCRVDPAHESRTPR